MTVFISSPSLDQGVIVGISQDQAWLLPWWWMHFRVYNSHPVTFINMGDLSNEVLEWCRRRGPVLKLQLSDEFMAKKEAVDPIKFHFKKKKDA